MRWLIAFIISLPAFAHALDIEDYFLQNCSKNSEYLSPLHEYASPQCPNLTGIVSCLNDTGFGQQGRDIDQLRLEIETFKNESLASCKAACEADDFGACAIFGNTKIYGVGEDSPQLRFEKASSLVRACEGGVVEVCGDAGQEMQVFWIAKQPERLERICREKARAVELRQCLHAKYVQDYVQTNPIEAEPPNQIFEKGCLLNDVSSCRLLIGFHVEYELPFESEFDAVALTDHTCQIGTAIQCKHMQAMLAKYEALF